MEVQHKVRFVICCLFWYVVLVWIGYSQDTIDHPAVCATPKAHVFPTYKEAIKDPEVKEIYQKVASLGGSIKAEFGTVYHPPVDEQGPPVAYTSLWLWIKDRGIDKRVIYMRTHKGLKVLIIFIPGGTVDSGLIEFLKKVN